jgi:uncharacterized membrane protein
MRKNIVDVFVGLCKYVIGYIFTLIFRLLSPFFGLWNISPLMATELAGSKAYGPWAGGLYGFFSILLIDMIMGKVGQWTFITAVTYGFVGVWAAYFLSNKKANAYNFVVASIIGTLFFDLITGVFMAPLLFGQPWVSAIVGQIPFTLRHLAGNILFAMVLSPWFYRKIMINETWNVFSSYLNRGLNKKI